MQFSPDAITSLLTSLFLSGMIDDLAREREFVVRERKLDVRVLVWTMIVGFAADGEARSTPRIAVRTTARPARISSLPVSTTDSPNNWSNSYATSSTTPSRRSLSLTPSLQPSSGSATSSSPTPPWCG